MNIAAALLSRLLRHRADARAAPPGVGADAEAPLGCGWFDSSHELRCGLVVQEHPAGSAAAAELPLAQWFELELAAA